MRSIVFSFANIISSGATKAGTYTSVTTELVASLMTNQEENILRALADTGTSSSSIFGHASPKIIS
jgi:hypothetical protein